MQIPVTLTKDQKRVLHLLINFDAEIPFNDLDFVYDRLNEADWDIEKVPSVLRNYSQQEHNSSYEEMHREEDTTLYDLQKILLMLSFAGLVTLEIPGKEDDIRSTSDFYGAVVKLTDEGKPVARQLAEGRNILIRQKPTLRKTVFVAMAFGNNDLDALYKAEIEPASKSLGYSCFRIDREEPCQTITDSVLSGILEAACVIADLTFARPSVYFEVGFALALGVPLLLTCKKDHYRGEEDNCRIHFDLEQFKISFWNMSKNGMFTWAEGMSPSDRINSLIPKCS